MQGRTHQQYYLKMNTFYLKNKLYLNKINYR
jgi:hypothetical protein